MKTIRTESDRDQYIMRAFLWQAGMQSVDCRDKRYGRQASLGAFPASLSYPIKNI